MEGYRTWKRRLEGCNGRWSAAGESLAKLKRRPTSPGPGHVSFRTRREFRVLLVTAISPTAGNNQ